MLRARSVCCREMGWAVVIQGQVFAVSAKKFVGPVEVMSARLCSASLSMYSTNARGGEESRSVQPGSGLVRSGRAVGMVSPHMYQTSGM